MMPPGEQSPLPVLSGIGRGLCLSCTKTGVKPEGKIKIFQTDKEDIDFSRNIMYNYVENSLREDGPMDS